MRAVLIAAILALASCGPPPQGSAKQTASTESPPTAPPGPPNNCPATASSRWSAGGESFAIEAMAFAGADCASSRVFIIFRGADGAIVHREGFETSRVMTLAGAESVEDMTRRLTEWINPPGAAPDSTGDLPAWTAGAPQPGDGEFPFYPEEGVTRADYEALRQQNAPMFCFVQGMESQGCIVAQNGAIRKIGVQSFPG